jgi:hypothetical protein
MIVLLKLIFAHVLGDFGLQFKNWVDHKRDHGLRSGYLYLHVTLHAIITALFLWPEISRNSIYLWVPFIIFGTHFAIDASKLVLRKKLTTGNMDEDTSREQALFFSDQLLHLLVIVGIWLWLDASASDILSGFFTHQSLLLLFCLFFLMNPSAILIKIFIAGWLPENDNKEKKTLANAGKWIGILERLFVFGFVVSGNWSGIGFLLAAKSVFRFGDLKEKEGIKFTEYILIGTLLSFGLAMLVSLFYLKFQGFLR